MRLRAQELRKNATKEERHLWYDFLKTFPMQFRRQVVFGPYIVDFYCAAARLAVELDGSQHYQGSGPDSDRSRTEYLLREHGISVLRFSNLDIQRNFEGVCTAIIQALKERDPSSAALRAPASPQGEAKEKPSPLRGEAKEKPSPLRREAKEKPSPLRGEGAPGGGG